MKLGVLGGTFDPIHLGHLILAEQAREQLGLDKVRFVPAGEPWRKAGRPISPAEQRLEMVRLATAGDPHFEVDDCEVRRQGPSYTLDTLRLIRSQIGDKDEIYLIVGEDALADMPNWHEPAAIAELARIVVAPREGAALPVLPLDRSRLVYIEMPYIGISASDLRGRAQAGRSLRYLVPAAVEAYIREKGLYAA